MIHLLKATQTRIYIGIFLLVTFIAFGLSVSAQSGDYNLSVSASTITAGETVTINWIAPAGSNLQQDWVGLYEVGSSNRDFLDWKYVTTSQRSVNFVIHTPGTYEFRYLKNNGYQQVARSAVITVAAYQTPIDVPPVTNGQYSLTVAENSYNINDTVRVNWTAPTGVNMRQDWIGVYKVGSNNRTYADWSYLNSSGTGGSLSFTITSPGTYEFRYLKNDGFEQVATSRQFIVRTATAPVTSPPPQNNGYYTVTIPNNSYKVNEQVTVSWSAPSNRSVRQGWIGVFAVNATDQQFEDWKYINQSSDSGTLTLTLRKTGTYEVRFFTGDGYERRSTSRQFTVTPSGNQNNDPNNGLPSSNYQLNVNPQSITTGQSVAVSWTAAANDNRQRDWIGLYRTNANNSTFLDWTYVTTAAGTTNFTITSPGTYEFRYLKNDGFTSVATSQRIQVTNGTASNPTPTPTPTPTQCAVVNVNNVTNYPPGNGPIIALGDSLTEGVGAANNRDYVSQLEDLVGVPIRNEGVSGDTTEEALARLEQSVISSNPSVVIVWLGGNDILGRYYARVQSGLENASLGQRLELLALQLSGKIPDTTNISEAQTFTNLETIVNRIHASGAVVILVGFSGGVFDDSLDSRYQAVATTTGAIYVPNIMSGIIGRPSLMSDLVHPNSAGYARVAERIAPYLQCVL